MNESLVKLHLTFPKTNKLSGEMIGIKEHPNEAGGPGLEALVSYLEIEMRPNSHRPPFNLQELAWKFTKFTQLREIPVRSHLDRLLSQLGIAWETHAQEFEPTFFYSEQSRRWEIHTSNMEDAWMSTKIIHEVFEIVCWRCYHRISWWKKWAAEQKMINPHDKAEEFAFLVVLPDGKFRALAKKLKYDLWALAGICQVPPHLCFQALNRHVSFPYPMFHAHLRCGVDPPEKPLSLFDDSPQNESWAIVRRRGYRARKKDGIIDWSGLEPEEWLRWSAVSDMEKFAQKGEYISLAADDVIEMARHQSKFTVTKARRVAGMPLGSMATVIVRTPDNTVDSVYFQVIPIGCEAEHLCHNSYSELL